MPNLMLFTRGRSSSVKDESEEDRGGGGREEMGEGEENS